MQRYGMVIGLDPGKAEEYKRLHVAVWSEVLKMIGACHIRNYSIFLREPENLVFSYFEYRGGDFQADMARMARDPKTRDWWKLCGPCQRPLETRQDGEWWAPMAEVFHTD